MLQNAVDAAWYCSSKHGKLYVKLPALVLGRYGVPHAETNSTD